VEAVQPEIASEIALDKAQMAPEAHAKMPMPAPKALITVNVTNVTCSGCYHFRWSESLHNQNKSWFFVNNWDSCKIRDS